MQTTEEQKRPATFALVETRLLRPHEEIVESHVKDLVASIRKVGGITRPILADRESLVVLDGHHRLEALRRLGIRHAPVHLVDYHDPGIVLDVWRKNEAPPTKEEVVARARAGRLYPPKTTRHLVKEDLHEVRVTLAELE